MTFKNKAIELASDARNSAENLSSELQQSQLLDKAKSTLIETKHKVSSVDTSGVKLMNFFSVFSLSALLISTFFPIVSVMGSSMPLSEVTPSWLYVVAILALSCHLFGVKQVVSRSLITLLVVAIIFTLYQQFSDTLQAARMFGSLRIDDLLTIALRSFGVGFYLFLMSFVLVIIATLKPGYKVNSEFWNKLIQH